MSGVDGLEMMSAGEVCEWLKNHSGKTFEDYILSAIIDNDLDGEALSVALGQGPECLKEVIPSLSKRLKLIGAIQVLRVAISPSSLTLHSNQPSVSTHSELDIDCISSEVSVVDVSPALSNCTPRRVEGKGHGLSLASSCSSKTNCSNSLAEFVLPIFRPETQKNLQAERLMERDRRYIVRTLSTMLLSSNAEPSLSDCCVPAKALVRVYPFLGDATMDGKEPYYSWAKFISQRCANVNRNADKTNEDGTQKTKRKKMENHAGKHQYLDDINSIILDDAVAYNRNVKKLSSELAKSHPVPENLEELMLMTYPNRRSSILSGELGVLEVCEKFSLLRKPKHICLEFARVTGSSYTMDDFKTEWNGKWSHAIFEVAREEGYMDISHDTNSDDSDVEGFKLLVKLLVPKKRKDALSQVFLAVKTGTPHDEIVGNSNQPMIVLMYDTEEIQQNHYYIMVEQELLQETNHFSNALFLLLAVHYVFNLQYNSAVSDVLLFLQEFVVGLKDSKVKHSAVYTATTTRIIKKAKKFKPTGAD